MKGLKDEKTTDEPKSSSLVTVGTGDSNPGSGGNQSRLFKKEVELKKKTEGLGRLARVKWERRY